MSGFKISVKMKLLIIFTLKRILDIIEAIVKLLPYQRNVTIFKLAQLWKQFIDEPKFNSYISW